ncbi:unnamed protein product [Schistosoma bovis]|nr:unnamed protein product [Schistosoma bovis]
MNKTLCESIRWYVSQIKGSNPEDIADGDNFTCVEFNESGELLATGDKAGRVTVFKNNKDTGLYDIYCTFTSHEPEFDYLKSLEIEEKINSITWLQAYSSAHHLLSANDKTIKLWRLSERHYEAYNFNIRDDENASLWDESSDRLNMIGPPIPHIITPDKLRIPKFRKSRHLTIEARPRRFFANAHAYHINAVSVNSDQETFLSADDLRINLWHLDVTNQSFTIVDLKPSNMEDLSEVITCSRFHPVQCNILAYSTSRGLIRLCDMRYRALCDDHVLVFEDPSLSQNLGFFADIIASLSDFRFGHTGNYLLARDYLTLKRRTRLEPLAVIVLSVFMGSISIQLVAESVQAIVRMSQNNQEAPNVNDLALGIMASVIVTKLILWIICFKFGGGMAIDALKTDQRNDILTNAASILFSGLAGRLPPLLRQSETWKTHPIEVFRKRLSSNIRKTKTTSKSVMEFYRRQDEHIRELEKIATIMEAETSDVEVTSNHHSIRRQTRINTMIIGVVFCANVVLLLGKAVASALSGSLAIISSLLDSCVDLASGGIMWFAARQMRKRKPYKYPEGRTRLEPLAVIVLSVFMGSISIQLVAESVQAIVRMSQNNQEAPNVNDLALGIMASVIVTKLILWIIFFKFGGGMAIDALKTDQRNDILTNAASILFSGLAGRLPPLLRQSEF